MKKILATTDFSKHAKAGLRFAIQLATQKEAELIFFHCFQALIPTTIHREHIENAIREQTQSHLRQLEKMVALLYKSMKIKPGQYRCVVVENLSPENAILDYAHNNGLHYICISTRGAGGLRKIVGTNTSSVILKSAVPVIAVPHTYRIRPLKKVLYASDLEQIDREMQVVSAFAHSAQLRMDLVHFYYPTEMKLDQDTLAEMWRRKHPELEGVFLQAFDLDAGFAGQLDRMIRKTKPGLVAFFTHTNKTWFDKIFSLSRSEAFSFITKVPMLVYRKR
jgi:nucleotide-binding universal stress UspA family protein